MSFNDIVGVVIDVGSQTTKAGFVDELTPRRILPSAVARLAVQCTRRSIKLAVVQKVCGKFDGEAATDSGRQKLGAPNLSLDVRFRHKGLLDGFPISIHGGREAIKMRGLSHLTWPMQGGQVQNWDDLEKLWHHIFYKELQIAPEMTRVLHTISPMAQWKDLENMTELLFESFAICDLYLAKTPTLALHASGRTSGVVWECGHTCSFVAPVFEGFHMKYATYESSITGAAISNYLNKLMSMVGYSFTTDVEKDIVENIKARMCYVANSYDEELDTAIKTRDKVSYTLPDGQVIYLREEVFKCPELLFRPSLEDLNCPSLVDNITTSIGKCELDYQPLFWNNIVLSGGTSMLPGIERRLRRELVAKAAPSGNEVKIEANEDRQHAAWVGGSILGSLSSMKGFWITAAEYADVGGECVNHRLL